MSTTKTQMKWFDVTDHEKEQEYLREMHKNGWKMVSVKVCVYTFESCEPEDVIYQLDYHAEMEDRDAYLQMFRDCGWEYIQDSMGYSYFRKSAKEMQSGEERIFSDDESRIAMWDRVFKGRVKVLLILLCAVLIPGALNAYNLGYAGGAAVFWVYVVMIGLYIVILGKFAWKYNKVKSGRNE